jgi:hypothetical protein
MKGLNAIQPPCKKRPPGRIKANIRGFYPAGHFLLLCRMLRSQATYRVAPHGIGGAATHHRRRIVVGITIVVAISESGRRTRILENALIYSFVPSLLFSVFARQ